MIRLAKAEDVVAIFSIQQECGYNSWSESNIAESVSKGHCWLLEHQHTVIGFALFQVVLDEAELLNIVLKKDYQGKGMAQALLSHAFSELFALDVTRFFLEVGVNNHKAIQLYDNFGFRVTGKRENYYKNNDGAEDALIMQYVLKGQK